VRLAPILQKTIKTSRQNRKTLWYLEKYKRHVWLFKMMSFTKFKLTKQSFTYELRKTQKPNTSQNKDQVVSRNTD